MAWEFYFNLKKARIYQAVKWAKHPVFRWADLFQKIFFILFVFAALLFFTSPVFLRLSIIFLVVVVWFRLTEAFFNQKLKNPEFLESENLAEFLSFEVAKAVNRARKNLNSYTFFYYLLTDNDKVNFVFYRLLLDINEIKTVLKPKLLIQESEPKRFPGLLLEALKIAQNRGRQRIETGDVLIALAKQEPIFQKILIEAKLKIKDLENLFWWQESLDKKIQKRKRWWDYENLMKKGTLAKEWTAGYTINLDRYSIDWTEIGKKQGFPEVIGHATVIEQVERILARREYNNVLLVGEPGVGRKAVVQAIVQKSILGQSLPDVNYKRVVELDLPGLLAQISDPEQVEVMLDTIFQETILAGNIILVINEFHNFIGTKPGPGMIDISGVIASYLHLPQFQVVAVTTYAGLHKTIEQNPSILNLLEKVEVPEISEQETMMILENLTLVLEQKYKLFVSYPALQEIISLSRRFLPYLPFPKKAMDLLDGATIYVKRKTKEKVVLPEHIAAIIEEKTEVPVGELEVKEKEILLNLENLIHQRIINQDEAVKEVSTALRRARAEVTVRKGPMGCFLFLGPTGVGKTETSKALAEIYFGSEEKMIRLDMSEFQDVKDIPRLIGSAGEEGLLTTKVREAPFSLILLDELEKAHANILNLFLQVLDEGHLTDGLGRKIDFKNSIIIATSNAGYQVILEAIKKGTDWSTVKQTLLDFLFQEAIFRPEFINRFDAVVVFRPLSKENLLDIAELLLQKLKANLKEKGIDFVVSQALKEKIVDLGYSPVFGARQMRRVIQDKVENILASALLSGELKRGDKAEIDSEEFKLKINP